MKLLFRSLLVALAAIALTSTAFAAEPQVDRAGYKDYPGISSCAWIHPSRIWRLRGNRLRCP